MAYPRGGDLSFQIDLQKIVSDQMKAAHAAIEAGYTEILFKAFMAGHEKGFRTGAYGPDEFGGFDEWLAEFIEDNRLKF